MEIDSKRTYQHPIRCKLLRRYITLNESPEKVLAYTKLKKIYLHKIKEKPSKFYKAYNCKDKQLICLRSIHLDPTRISYGLNLVKSCKNLKHIILGNSSENLPLKSFLPFIKRLSKNIKGITISASNVNAKAEDIPNFYRSLGAFKKLNFLRKYISYCNSKREINLVEKEYCFMDRYFSRLNDLKEFYCNQRSDRRNGFLRCSLWNKPCKFMTGLAVELSDEHEIEMGDDEFEENEEIDRNHIEPFLRFRLFPNLRRLNILFSHSYKLEPFIAEGFQGLTRLEHLNLSIENEQDDYGQLFEGLLHFPLLKSFSLEVLNLKRNEGQLLVEFLFKQTQLVYLSLSIESDRDLRTGVREHRKYIEDICSNLSNTPNLRYLTLQSSTWSLESLSKGLKNTITTNQLVELKIQMFDDFALTSLSPAARVEGLCSFIKKQKDSLKWLGVTLALVKEDEVLDNIINAFAELGQLKSLSFKANSDYHDSFQVYSGDLRSVVRKSLEGCPPFRKTFHLLSQNLQKLEKLDRLDLNLNPLMHSNEKFTVNSSVVFNAFPKIKHLKHLELSLPFLQESMADDPLQALILLELKEIVSMIITAPKAMKIREIELAMLYMRERQDMQRFLIFMSNI